MFVRVLLVDHNEQRRALVLEGLRDVSDMVVHFASGTLTMLDQIARHSPDLVIIACDTPARDTLEDLKRVTQTNPKPIIMFVDRSAPEETEEALRAGVAAYVVDGLSASRVRSVLDLAKARFRVMQDTREDIARARAQLEDRKVMDRAKGLLMKRRGIDEPAAFALLRKSAMDRCITIAAVAREILEAEKLLGGEE